MEKIEVGQVWKMRDGHKARVICVDQKNGYDRPIVVLREYVDGLGKLQETVVDLRLGGVFATCVDHDYDLVSLWRDPIKVSGWMNVYSSSIPGTSALFHKTKEEADFRSTSNRIACVYVSGEEGVEPEEDK